MFRHPLFYAQFAVLILVAVLHSFGVYASLYWLWLPFDIIVHFLGGVWVGLAALWFFFYSPFTWLNWLRLSKLGIALLAVVIVGLLWEAFEFIAKVPQDIAHYEDTVLDIIMDILGAIGAWWFVERWYGK